MNCTNIENATRQQLQKNCVKFKSDKKIKADCRTNSSILLELSKTLCSFYNHTLVENAVPNHRTRVVSNTRFDFSQYNEPLAHEAAFPSDDQTLAQVSNHLLDQILKCYSTAPEINTFDIICLGTGMNTAPELYLYKYLQFEMTKMNL